jgi:2-phosphoglycerate kinase
VEGESGLIEEFKTDRILNSLIEVGVDPKAAKEIVDRVQYKLCKLDPPVSKPTIKKAIIEELENENSKAVKKYRKSRIWK